MDTKTKPTLDLVVCGNPLIIDTDYRSLDRAQKALELAMERVKVELDYIENQPHPRDVIEHKYIGAWD